MNNDNKKNMSLKEEILEFIVERYFNNETIQDIVEELEEFKKTNGNKVSNENKIEILKNSRKKIGITALKLERISKGLTQAELAILANVSMCSIVRLEKGDLKTVSVRTLLKLSKALDTTVTNLFFGQEEI